MDQKLLDFISRIRRENLPQNLSEKPNKELLELTEKLREYVNGLFQDFEKATWDRKTLMISGLVEKDSGKGEFVKALDDLERCVSACKKKGLEIKVDTSGLRKMAETRATNFRKHFFGGISRRGPEPPTHNKPTPKKPR